MNCPDCGELIEDSEQFCPKCYARAESPGLWQKLLSLFGAPRTPHRPVVNLKKSVVIKTTEQDGQHHEYHSLAEAPPELRRELEQLETEALKGNVTSTPNTTIKTKSVSVYRIKDASGNERVYHSLDEMPPEIRAAIERAQKGA